MNSELSKEQNLLEMDFQWSKNLSFQKKNQLGFLIVMLTCHLEVFLSVFDAPNTPLLYTL